MKCKTCNQEIISNIQEIPAKRLEWGAVSEKEMTWNEAVKWCEAQGEGWRLPTRIELLQAFEEKIEGFKGDSFWSSTENYNNTANAWYVFLTNGFTYTNTKVTSDYVRCCRNIPVKEIP